MTLLLLICLQVAPTSPDAQDQSRPQIHVIKEEAEKDWDALIVAVVSLAFAGVALFLALRSDRRADRAEKRVDELEAPNLEIPPPQLIHNLGTGFQLVILAINRSSLPDAIMDLRVEYHYQGDRVVNEWQVLVQHENQQQPPDYRRTWPGAFPVNIPPLTALPIRAKGDWIPNAVIIESQIPADVRELTHTIVVKTLRGEEHRFETTLQPRNG